MDVGILGRFVKSVLIFILYMSSPATRYCTRSSANSLIRTPTTEPPCGWKSIITGIEHRIIRFPQIRLRPPQ